MIAIIDLGSQYVHLIARRVSEIGVPVVVYPPDVSLCDREIRGIILSGGPGDMNRVKIEGNFLRGSIPVLGICLGMQYIAKYFGGTVDAGKREYGSTEIRIVNHSRILKGIEKKFKVWMSHQYEVKRLPERFRVVASSEDTEVAAFEGEDIFGLQFHPEVFHTEYGKEILRNFVVDICGEEEKAFSASSFVKSKTGEMREKVGNSKVIAGVSGGVDSSVMALLLKKAVGEKFLPVFVDTGLLRRGEEDEVKKNLSAYLSIKFIDAEEDFLSALKGVSDPEEKRKRIGRKFIEVFKRVDEDVEFLAQGTLYPDRIESLPQIGQSRTIKTHHNVGGLPEDMPFKLVEPLKELFKDEVRMVGRELGLSESVLSRHPFPGPGLAVRIIGEVTREKLGILREADHIFVNGLVDMGLYDDIWQAFCVLLPVKSVGVMGDERTYEYVLVMRAVTSTDGMTASIYRFGWDDLTRLGDRIVREVRGVNRVVYDITSKPPATIEWE